MARIPKAFTGAMLSRIKNARDMFVLGVAADGGDGELEYPTVASLAGVAGVSKVTLYAVAKRECWKADRLKVQMAVREKRDIDHAELAIRKGKSIDELAVKGCELVLKEFVRRMAAADDEMRSTDISNLTTAARTAHQMGKLAIGEPTEITGDYDDSESIAAFKLFLEEYEKLPAEKSRRVDPKLVENSPS